MTELIDERNAGTRLDDAVRRLTGESLRGARRLLERGLVRVNGKQRPAHYRLRPGDEVRVCAEEVPASGIAPSGVRIVATAGEYVFLHKPAGLHSAMVSGSGEASLEAILRDGWADLRRSFETDSTRAGNDLPPPLAEALAGHLPSPTPQRPLANAAGSPILLTRLDAPTSGLLVAALTEAAAERFRAMEAEGRIRKFYLAAVRGHVPGPLRLSAALDTDKRRVTRTIPGKDGDETRHTLVFPLGDVPGSETGDETLVLAVIRRGARHQIRAHLAAAGFPLSGDTLYAPDGEQARFFLHHLCMELPEFAAFDSPERLCDLPERKEPA